MFEINETDYGLKLTISGQLTADQATEFVQDVKNRVRQHEQSFCVLADLREMEAFPPDVGQQITELMEFCDSTGMERSVTVVETATTSLQMEQLVEESGINERAIDASRTDDWEAKALDWIENGIEPNNS
jgi:polyhydroxyalkanoate synthesis regulator phasin